MRLAALLFALAVAPAAAGDLPPYLADRGTGVALSMFGTYIEKGEFLLYPFFEYYRDGNLEYQPDELGRPDPTEHRGRYRASELLLFLGYGVSEDLAIEVEAARIDAELRIAEEDRSGLPPRIEESGLGDVEAQLRFRAVREAPRRPELFGYLETVFPTADEGSLIGTADWELKLGLGLVKGTRAGTFTLRGAAEYAAAEGRVEPGELAVEYFKRLSRPFRLFLAVEGAQDEWEVITELQWHLGRRVFVKLNSALGLTSKATDWAPEVGIAFRL